MERIKRKALRDGEAGGRPQREQEAPGGGVKTSRSGEQIGGCIRGHWVGCGVSFRGDEIF